MVDPANPPTAACGVNVYEDASQRRKDLISIHEDNHEGSRPYKTAITGTMIS